MKIVYYRGCKNQYKTGNTGTGNERNRGNVIFRGMWPKIPGNVLKHFGECRQTFRGMWPNILGNVLKHSGECRQIFRGMSPNILGNVAKYSGKCRQTFWGMSSNIPGNVAKYSEECRQIFWGMSPNIPGNVAKHFGECRQTFRGCPRKIQRIFENNLWHVVKHSVESMKGFGWIYIIALDTGDQNFTYLLKNCYW